MATQAARTASVSLPFAPSMVVTSAPSSVPMGATQERRGSPFTCTVQAPH
jgi:hypothetical protein